LREEKAKNEQTADNHGHNLRAAAGFDFRGHFEILLCVSQFDFL
jgi:predicted Zn-dependent protease